jgi:ArsR family transcriptional regulator, arsenate/arsenite/antimonite-responsive transcriptional repressor
MYKLVKALKALSDDVRLRIVNLLMQRECCVCEVMQALRISQTRASRNLNMLYDAGFLKLRKEGLWSYYSIAKDDAERYLSLLTEAVENGLKNDEESEKDRKRLNEAQPMGPGCCGIMRAPGKPQNE